MNLETFSSIIEQYTPTGYTFWAGGRREQYNIEKQISDTMLLVLPNPFPVNWREACSQKVTFSLWFGKLIEIKRTTTGEQQHDPYSPLELRSGLYGIAEQVISNLNGNQYVQVVTEASMGTFYDSPDGKSVNRQVWLEVPVTAIVYNAGDSFDYYLDMTFNS